MVCDGSSPWVRFLLETTTTRRLRRMMREGLGRLVRRPTNRGLMALEIRQTQKLQQQLVITLQLQQAIKLLQLNHQELVVAVQKEMLENPALEEIPGTSGGTITDAEASLQADANAQRQDVVDQNNGAQEERGMDWTKVLEDMASQPRGQGSVIRGNQDELPPIEATLTRSADLIVLSRFRSSSIVLSTLRSRHQSPPRLTAQDRPLLS